MPARRGIKQFAKAIEKIEQQKLWEFYCSVYVHLKKRIPFEEYYRQSKARVNKAYRKNLSKEEIIKIAEDIKARHLTMSKKGKK